MDRRGRDQFVIRYGDETEVCWNDHQKQLAEQVSPCFSRVHGSKDSKLSVTKAALENHGSKAMKPTNLHFAMYMS